MRCALGTSSRALVAPTTPAPVHPGTTPDTTRRPSAARDDVLARAIGERDHASSLVLSSLFIAPVAASAASAVKT
jgi:hypothetical protein